MNSTKPIHTAAISLVLQSPHPKACQQSVIAMLSGVSLKAVTDFIGTDSLSYQDREKTCLNFGIKISEDRFVVEAFGNQAIGALIKKYRTLWFSVSDCLNSSFGHAALWHDGVLLDPHYGINPQWPWSHYVTIAQPVNPKIL